MSTYKLLSYQINKEARAGVLVGDTVYDVQKVTATAAYATVMGVLADWAQAKKTLVEFMSFVYLKMQILQSSLV